ncbi:MAG: preprotein translocase subunit SecA [Elusimicrobia bacterium RIFCSPLOWO2_01_FULL_64_13]|nr:MAG: preprotein translocase subunit SecA [Elusimicrobia bacterium RIFCSPLOWO2_01_FULL_64_13]
MFKLALQKIFGSSNERYLKKLAPQVGKVNALEEDLSALTDGELKGRTAEFRRRLEAGETEDDLLPEAFAAVREASKRTIGLRHFDVQLLGGMALHEGKIAEMRTGEGKTLVATLSAYLNGISGKGVHVVTVNDYLARRDRDWMGPVYEKLGLTVGFVQHDMPNAGRGAAYACDITYVTNNEIGFDYLRDNMVVRRGDRVLRPLNYAIVDEVDSILIDEARTPLIISGPAEESTQKYHVINRVIPRLKGRIITEKEEIDAKYTGEKLETGYDFLVDEKAHTATLTDEGVAKCEKLLGLKNLYDDLSGEWVHHISQALRAHHLYKRDVDYVVKDGEVLIVDEFTGRLMPGRRWSEGLHQAVEAKENLRIAEENQTLATITFQNYFRMYKKLSGMTGTALTESEEFWTIYKLDVVEIPTNKPMIRADHPDLIYRTQREKFEAIIAEIETLWKSGRPVLVGTRSIEISEKLSGMLRRAGVPHQVLNAKYHEQEAHIIAQAGRKGAVTIATNMAGRGTDIVLGGNPSNAAEAEAILKVGGLHVLGSERHEARRIDNQLRGRTGRQGDPGSSRFYLALDDELMRLFGGERLSQFMDSKFLQSLGSNWQEGESIESGLLTRQIESAQRKVEAMNFDIRKQLLDFDNVMNKQREAIYDLRNDILDGEDVSVQVQDMIGESVEEKLELWCPEKEHPEEWDLKSLSLWMKRIFEADLSFPEGDPTLDREAIRAKLEENIRSAARAREEDLGRETLRDLERMILLHMMDTAWKEHLYDLDHLKKGINLRAYAQKDPKIEYQKESFELFEQMMNRIRENAVEYIFRLKIMPAVPPRPVRRVMEEKPDAVLAGPVPHEPGGSGGGGLLEPAGRTVAAKIGRNDPCPCGSGKKFKKCCGK